MMFWIFLAVDMFTLGIIYAVYGGNRKYSEGMLMGVHMPESAAESEEVTAFMKSTGSGRNDFICGMWWRAR